MKKNHMCPKRVFGPDGASAKQPRIGIDGPLRLSMAQAASSR